MGPRFALIDSLIVLSENGSVHFEVTRCVGNLPLPHRILRIGDGRDFFFFQGSPPRTADFQHIMAVVCVYIDLLHSTTLQKTHTGHDLQK